MQHAADLPQFFSRGLKTTFSCRNIETDPQNFLYLTLIIVDAFVGPENPDFLAVAQHVLIDAERILVRVAFETIHKARQISAFKPGRGRQYTEHRFAYNLLGGISEELFAIKIDKSDFAFGIQAQNDCIDFVHQEFATVLFALFLLTPQG